MLMHYYMTIFTCIIAIAIATYCKSNDLIISAEMNSNFYYLNIWSLKQTNIDYSIAQ